MNKLTWTLFGMTLSAVLALGGFASGLLPLFERPATVVVTFDDRVETLELQVAELGQERDRLTANLAALQADQAVLLDDLADVMVERDRLSARLEEPAPDPAAPSLLVPAAPAPPDLVTGQVEGSLLEDAAVASLAVANSVDLMELGLRAYRRSDYGLAFNAWLPLARGGNARAQFFLGGLYDDGSGVPQDPVQAYVWLRRAEAGGYGRAGPLLAKVARGLSREQFAEAERQLAL